MKKIIVILLTCLIMFSCLNTNVIAGSNITEAPNIKVIVDEKVCKFNDVPIKVDGSIFLPLRELLINIGVQNDADHIIWNEKEGTLTVVKGNTKVVLKSDNATVNVNGIEVKLDAPPISYKGKIYVFVGFVTKCFDRPFTWDGATSSIIIEKAVKGNIWTSKQNIPFTLEPGSVSKTYKGSNGSTVTFVDRSDGSGMAVALENKIYIINSVGKVAAYDPTTDMWVTKNDIPEMKDSKGFYKLVTINNKIYIVGNNYNEILEYDPVTCKSALITKFAPGRVIGGAAAVNGKIYILGGFDINSLKAVDTVEEYDISANKWTAKKDKVFPSKLLVLTTQNNKIYVLNNTLFLMPSIEEYDPVTDGWTQKTKFEDASADSKIEFVDGKIYKIDTNNSSSNVMEYDIIKDKWTTKSNNIPRPREGACTVSLNGKIYVIGGYEDIWKAVSISMLSEANKDKYFNDQMTGNNLKSVNYVDEYTPPDYTE